MEDYSNDNSIDWKTIYETYCSLKSNESDLASDLFHCLPYEKAQKMSFSSFASSWIGISWKKKDSSEKLESLLQACILRLQTLDTSSRSPYDIFQFRTTMRICRLVLDFSKENSSNHVVYSIENLRSLVINREKTSLVFLSSKSYKQTLLDRLYLEIARDPALNLAELLDFNVSDYVEIASLDDPKIAFGFLADWWGDGVIDSIRGKALSGLKSENVAVFFRDLLNALNFSGEKLFSAFDDIEEFGEIFSFLKKQDHVEFSFFIEKVQKRISSLQLDEACTIPIGYNREDEGHTLILQVMRLSKNKYRLRLYNRGDGVHYHWQMHNGKKEKVLPFLDFESNLQSISSENFWVSIIEQRVKSKLVQADCSMIYGLMEQFFGKPLPWNSQNKASDFFHPHRTGVCVVGVMEAMLRDYCATPFDYKMLCAQMKAYALVSLSRNLLRPQIYKEAFPIMTVIFENGVTALCDRLSKDNGLHSMNIELKKKVLSSCIYLLRFLQEQDFYSEEKLNKAIQAPVKTQVLENDLKVERKVHFNQNSAKFTKHTLAVVDFDDVAKVPVGQGSFHPLTYSIDFSSSRAFFQTASSLKNLQYSSPEINQAIFSHYKKTLFQALFIPDTKNNLGVLETVLGFEDGISPKQLIQNLEDFLNLCLKLLGAVYEDCFSDPEYKLCLAKLFVWVHAASCRIDEKMGIETLGLSYYPIYETFLKDYLNSNIGQQKSAYLSARICNEWQSILDYFCLHNEEAKVDSHSESWPLFSEGMGGYGVDSLFEWQDKSSTLAMYRSAGLDLEDFTVPRWEKSFIDSAKVEKKYAYLHMLHSLVFTSAKCILSHEKNEEVKGHLKNFCLNVNTHGLLYNSLKEICKIGFFDKTLNWRGQTEKDWDQSLRKNLSKWDSSTRTPIERFRKVDEELTEGEAIKSVFFESVKGISNKQLYSQVKTLFSYRSCLRYQEILFTCLKSDNYLKQNEIRETLYYHLEHVNFPLQMSKDTVLQSLWLEFLNKELKASIESEERIASFHRLARVVCRICQELELAQEFLKSLREIEEKRVHVLSQQIKTFYLECFAAFENISMDTLMEKEALLKAFSTSFFWLSKDTSLIDMQAILRQINLEFYHTICSHKNFHSKALKAFQHALQEVWTFPYDANSLEVKDGKFVLYNEKKRQYLTINAFSGIISTNGHSFSSTKRSISTLTRLLKAPLLNLKFLGKDLVKINMEGFREFYIECGELYFEYGGESYRYAHSGYQRIDPLGKKLYKENLLILSGLPNFLSDKAYSFWFNEKEVIACYAQEFEGRKKLCPLFKITSDNKVLLIDEKRTLYAVDLAQSSLSCEFPFSQLGNALLLQDEKGKAKELWLPAYDCSNTGQFIRLQYDGKYWTDLSHPHLCLERTFDAGLDANCYGGIVFCNKQNISERYLYLPFGESQSIERYKQKGFSSNNWGKALEINKTKEKDWLIFSMIPLKRGGIHWELSPNTIEQQLLALFHYMIRPIRNYEQTLALLSCIRPGRVFTDLEQKYLVELVKKTEEKGIQRDAHPKASSLNILICALLAQNCETYGVRQPKLNSLVKEIYENFYSFQNEDQKFCPKSLLARFGISSSSFSLPKKKESKKYIWRKNCYPSGFFGNLQLKKGALLFKMTETRVCEKSAQDILKEIKNTPPLKSTFHTKPLPYGRKEYYGALSLLLYHENSEEKNRLRTRILATLQKREVGNKKTSNHVLSRLVFLHMLLNEQSLLNKVRTLVAKEDGDIEEKLNDILLSYLSEKKSELFSILHDVFKLENDTHQEIQKERVLDSLPESLFLHRIELGLTHLTRKTLECSDSNESKSFLKDLCSFPGNKGKLSKEEQQEINSFEKELSDALPILQTKQYKLSSQEALLNLRENLEITKKGDQNKVSSLSEQILDLANQKRNSSASDVLRSFGHFNDLITIEDLIGQWFLLEREDRFDDLPWDKLKPLIRSWLIRKIRMQQCNRVQKYIKQLLDMKGKEDSAAFQNQLRVLAEEIEVSRKSWKGFTFLEIDKLLIFEYLSNMRIRGEQALAIEQLSKNKNERFEDILQRVMSFGKSSVLNICLAALLADGTKTVFLCLTPALYASRYRFHKKLMQATGKNTISFRVSRSDCCRVATLERIILQLINAKKSGSILVSCPNDLKILRKMIIVHQTERTIDQECLDLLIEINVHLAKNGIVLYDEEDSIMHYTDELNLPLNQSNRLPVLGFQVVYRLLENLLRPDGFLRDLILQNKQDMLSRDRYRSEIIPSLLKSLKTCFLEKIQGTSQFHESLDAYLSGSTDKKQITLAFQELLSYHNSKDTELYQMAEVAGFIRGLLAPDNGILYSCLNVSGGDHYDLGPEGISMPHLGSDVPKIGSQDKESWETVLKTVFSYMWQQSTDKFPANEFRSFLIQEGKKNYFLRELIQKVSSIDASLDYWSEFTKVFEKNDLWIEAFHSSLHEENQEIQNAALYLLLRFLCIHLLPTKLEEFPSQVNANMFDLLDMADSIGYSATTRGIQHLGKRLDRSPMSTLQITEVICSPKNTVSVVQSESMNELFHEIEKLGVWTSEARFWIDAGGEFRNYSNRIVAEALCEFFAKREDLEMKYVLFYQKQEGDSMQLMALKVEDQTICCKVMDETVDSIAQACELSPEEAQSKVFIYADRLHTVGTDIQVVPGSKAFVTFRYVEREPFFQACTRMRLLLKKQHHLQFFIHQDMHEIICRDLNIETTQLTPKHLVYWSELYKIRQGFDANFAILKMRLKSTLSKHVFNKCLELEGWKQKKLFQIGYRLFVDEENMSLFARYGKHIPTLTSPQKAIAEEYSALMEIWKSCRSYFNRNEIESIEEEISSIASPNHFPPLKSLVLCGDKTKTGNKTVEQTRLQLRQLDQQQSKQRFSEVEQSSIAENYLVEEEVDLSEEDCVDLILKNRLPIWKLKDESSESESTYRSLVSYLFTGKDKWFCPVNQVLNQEVEFQLSKSLYISRNLLKTFKEDLPIDNLCHKSTCKRLHFALVFSGKTLLLSREEAQRVKEFLMSNQKTACAVLMSIDGEVLGGDEQAITQVERIRRDLQDACLLTGDVLALEKWLKRHPKSCIWTENTEILRFLAQRVSYNSQDLEDLRNHCPRLYPHIPD
ncbi:MAG: hypothetical protein CMO81_06600 [Waddliaceae bacterium]|nr:hypothetical protein [Waddliaceae bacterium]